MTDEPVNDEAASVDAASSHAAIGKSTRANSTVEPLPKTLAQPDWNELLAIADRAKPEVTAADVAARAVALDPSVSRFESMPDGYVSRLKDEHDRLNRPAIPRTISNIMKRVGVGQLHGPTDTGKSFVEMDLAGTLCNDSLTDWFGFPVNRHGPVVLVLMEGAYDYPARIAAWLVNHPGCTADALYTLEEEQLDLADSADRSRLVWDIRALGIEPVAVFVDTQGLATPGTEENSNTDMNLVFAGLKVMAKELDAFIVLVHHTGHNANLRGASAQLQACELAISVTMPAGTQQGQMVVVKTKDAPPVGRHLHFVVEPEGTSAWARQVTADEAQRHQEQQRAATVAEAAETDAATEAELRDRVIRVLREAGPAGLKPKDLEAAVRVDGSASSSRIRRVRDGLEQLGQIHQVEGTSIRDNGQTYTHARWVHGAAPAGDMPLDHEA